ncbi:MAG: hypothetical protein COB51_04085 [Moraxellaceae bacterium]|nr:MAG: hypothetical protein COB51_04085 [Moraxellaceae bacterium]
MAIFQYEAIRRDGDKVNGDIDAENSNIAAQLLRQKALFVLKIQGRNELTTISNRKQTGVAKRRYRSVAKSGLNKEFHLFKPSDKEWMQVYRQLSLMIRSGITLIEALELVARRAANSKVQEILFEVLERVENGASLAQAMGHYEDYFGQSNIQLISCGESSGNMADSLNDINQLMMYRAEQKKQIRAALFLPGFVLLTAIVVIYWIAYFLMPKFSMLVKDSSTMPLITQWLFGFTGFIQTYGLVLFVLMALAVLGTQRYYKTKHGRILIDSILLRAPMFGNIVVDAEMNRAFHTLNTLLKSGLSLVDSLEGVVKVSSNQYFVDKFTQVQFRLVEGNSFADSLEDKRVPELASHLVAIGERTGAMEEVTGELGEFYRQELEQRVKKMVSLIPIIMTFLIGGLVGFVYLGVILGIASTRF